MRRCDILKNRGYLAMKFGKTQSISKAYINILSVCLSKEVEASISLEGV